MLYALFSGATFPMPTLGAFDGCRLPDAILLGNGSLRPHSRAVQRLAVAEVLSEDSWPASAGGCATGLRTRSRHVCDFGSASQPVCAGSAIAFGGALAPCHGSDLLPLRLLYSHKSAVLFVTSPTFWKGSQALPEPASFPGLNAPVVPSFDVFRWAGSLSKTPPESFNRAGAQ
jgi:hypothetical protein